MQPKIEAIIYVQHAAVHVYERDCNMQESVLMRKVYDYIMDRNA